MPLFMRPSPRTISPTCWSNAPASPPKPAPSISPAEKISSRCGSHHRISASIKLTQSQSPTGQRRQNAMSIRKDQPPLTTPPSDLDHHLGYLKLSFIAGHYAELATQAVPKQWSHIDYLESLVKAKAQLRRDRPPKTAIRPPPFPSSKTLTRFAGTGPPG